MKISRFLFFFLGTFVSLVSLRAESATPSQISEVHVYMGSARVTRLSELELSSGENTLLFTGLPTSLDVNQIQLGLAEGVPIRLDNLKFQRVKDREDTPGEERLKEAIEELRDHIRILNAEKGDQSSRIEFANELSSSFTEGFGESELSMESLKRAEEVLEFQQKTSLEAQAKLRSLEDDLQELDEELKELLKELNEETQRANLLQGEVTVRLYAARAGDAKLVFNYLVPDASWFPSYAVRVDSSTNAMELVYQANIWQNSGESWNDVAITVSTSQPTRSGNVPELGPVYLQPYQPRMMSKVRAEVRAAVEQEVYELAPFSAGDGAAPVADKDYSATTQSRAGMSSFSATLPTKVSLESSTEPSRFPILTQVFQAKFWSEVVPLIQEKGFLKAETTNAFDLPLIAGQAQIFIDGTLTSRVSVPYALPGDELELSLGVDDYIQVNRKETLRETEYAGLIDKTTVLKRAYTVEVSNFHPVKHRIKLFERWPVSRNEKIIVKPKAPQKSQVELEEATGVFFWEDDLNARQKKEYKVEFEVVHPREWNLDGQI